MRPPGFSPRGCMDCWQPPAGPSGESTKRKDAALRDLYEKVLEMGHVQAVAITKVEAALVALKQAIEDLRHRRP